MIKTNEVLLKINNEWLHFAEPKQIIVAKTLEDILPASREMERLVNVNEWYAAGFLSYEAASAFDPALRTKAFSQAKNSRVQAAEFPFLWFGLYPSPRVISLPEPEHPKEILNWQPTIDRDTYKSSIDQIREHIAEGRTYQVNFTMRLQTDYTGSEWDFFLHLAQGQNNHAAYIDLGRYVICSASLELFFQLDGNTITCRPMKGTVRRGRTTLEDIKQAQWLKDSEKNRAENVMIVDMVRNDLGRIARIGSVNVPELFNTERYPTLWQMTSTVTAKTSASLTDIFSALFPSASITGAPKVGTMKIISELESTPRSIYTGSIGYISRGRKSEFNVAIRTALMDRQTQKAEYGVGGGIVWDSTSTDEYAEALLKARVLTDQPAEFSLLETILWTPEEGFFLREKHIKRMLDSADYFDYPISSQQRWLSSPKSSSRDVHLRRTAFGAVQVSKPSIRREIIETYLNEISSQFSSPQRVRLLLNKTGNLNFEAKSFQASENQRPLKVRLSKQPIDSDDVFLFHKTTKRDFYESVHKDAPGFDDVLLYNEVGELTEFTIGNLVVELEGRYFTPPLSCGLLAGIFRAHLLETGEVAERTIRVEELKDCEKIFLVNSVRKWQRAEIKLVL
ncbi:MAG: aminodeoxychorismate synthase component I [Chloroflexota bacterium]|nr:aminodeoxychorismate synthase component I [Chloroflexota bacterium]